MIVKAELTHATQIQLLEQKLFNNNPYTIDIITSDIQNERNLYYVDEENGNVVAYIVVSFIFDEANIVKIGVDEHYQHSGLGTKLIKHVENLLTKRGVRYVYLEVSRNNINAIQFYSKLGYTLESTRKSYYKDGSDALILSKRD